MAVVSRPLHSTVSGPFGSLGPSCARYWDARFPKLFTRDDLHRHVESGRDKLLGVCDITCDADGSASWTSSLQGHQRNKNVRILQF